MTLYQRRRAVGLCGQCGRPSPTGYCRRCAIHRRALVDGAEPVRPPATIRSVSRDLAIPRSLAQSLQDRALDKLARMMGVSRWEACMGLALLSCEIEEGRREPLPPVRL